MVISEAGNYMARRQRQVCVSDFSTAVFDNTVGVRKFCGMEPFGAFRLRTELCAVTQGFVLFQRTHSASYQAVTTHRKAVTLTLLCQHLKQ